MSTKPAVTLNSSWQLHPKVSVRPEQFGALLYHFGTRKLSFLKDLPLVQVVEDLKEGNTVSEAFQSAGIPQPDQDRYLSALSSLAESQMIQEHK